MTGHYAHDEQNYAIVTFTEASINELGRNLTIYTTDVAVVGNWVIILEEDDDGDVVRGYRSECVSCIQWPRKTPFAKVIAP